MVEGGGSTILVVVRTIISVGQGNCNDLHFSDSVGKQHVACDSTVNDRISYSNPNFVDFGIL